MARFGPLLLAVFLVALALPPRLLDTDRFVTTDELFWVGRAAAFGQAIETGRLAQTFQSGHPGVTTMWTAWLGMGVGLARDLAPSRREVSRREVSQSASFLPALASARRAFGLVTALGIGILGFMAWRLFGAWPALLGGSLLALDPFFLAHARLVHIDASLTLWMSVAVVAALYRTQGGGVWSLLLCGVATGLALLSKSPALMLLGLVPLALVPWRDWRLDRARLPAALRDGIVWALVAALTFVAAWPAIWAAPGDTFARYLSFVRDNANPDHAAAADDEGTGLLFYPLVLLFRSTPLMWLGLAGLLLPVQGWRWPGGRSLPILLLFAVGFGLAMTVAAKGFDRYLLPIFPALDLLAGLGLWRMASLVAARRLHPDSPSAACGRGGRGDPAQRRDVGVADIRAAQRPMVGHRGVRVVAGAMLLVVLGSGAWWIVGAWPYGLTYANPLVGGNPGAHRTIASGWGEGLDEAARYLNEHTNGGRMRAAMPGEIYTTVLGSQVNGSVAPAEGYDAGVYDALVVYLRNVQLGERPPFFDETLLAWTPDYTVTLNGVPYAWVYSTRAGAPVGAVYGGLLSLDGYGLDTAAPRVGRRLELRLRWRALNALPAGLGVVVELRPAGGGRPVSLTLPLEPTGQPTTWAVEDRVSVSYQLPLDPALSPGEYVVAVRVVGSDGHPLPVTAQPPRPAGVSGEPDAVPLRRIQPR